MKDFVSMKRSRNNRRRGMPRPHTSFNKYITQNERIGIYEVFKRKKQFTYISKIWKYEICIPKLRILV